MRGGDICNTTAHDHKQVQHSRTHNTSPFLHQRLHQLLPTLYSPTLYCTIFTTMFVGIVDGGRTVEAWRCGQPFCLGVARSVACGVGFSSAWRDRVPLRPLLNFPTGKLYPLKHGKQRGWKQQMVVCWKWMVLRVREGMGYWLVLPGCDYSPCLPRC